MLALASFCGVVFGSLDAHAVGYCRNCQTVHERTPTLEESRKTFKINVGCSRIEQKTQELVANTEAARHVLDRVCDEIQKNEESESSLRRKLLFKQKELTIQFLAGAQEAFEKNTHFQEKWGRFFVEEEISYLTFVQFQMSVENMENFVSHLEQIQRMAARNMARINSLD